MQDRGSRDWRLDPHRARNAEFLVCTQNCHNAGFGAPTATHAAAFLIGRIAGVVPSPERPDRWLIEISEYVACNIPGVWGRSGHLRYPVWYTTLEDLGIDLAALPPFQSLPPAALSAPGPRAGLAEAALCLAVPPPHRTADPDAARRFDAILAQLDRIPELAASADPLDWDERGLPR